MKKEEAITISIISPHSIISWTRTIHHWKRCFTRLKEFPQAPPPLLKLLITSRHPRKSKIVAFSNWMISLAILTKIFINLSYLCHLSDPKNFLVRFTSQRLPWKVAPTQLQQPNSSSSNYQSNPNSTSNLYYILYNPFRRSILVNDINSIEFQ